MDEREQYGFDPAQFSHPAEETVSTPCADDAPRGSAVLGILGALLGALVGAVPWFLASTFASFFIGWLGFLVGIAACYGYRKLRGPRSTRFAMTTVILSSIFVLFIAELGSWMFILCTDPDWQADAAWLGISVAQLAWESLMMPENWSLMAPNMLIGMVIGLLGVLSSKQKVLAYTEPERAARSQDLLATAGAAQANAAAGFAVPQRFTVHESKGVKIFLYVVGGIGCLMFGPMLGYSVVRMFRPTEDMPVIAGVVFALLSAALLALCLFAPVSARRYLAVDGGSLVYQPTLGGTRSFRCADIAGIMQSGAQGRKLVGHDGKTLARFEDNQQNSALLLQYLSERGVSLLAK